MDDRKSFPSHIAVIMDGNGRWATKRLMPRTAGHMAGFKKFVELVENCDDLGVKNLTVYAFSTENASRDPSEVSALFGLASKAIDKYESTLQEHNIRGIVIGDLSMVDASLAEKIRGSEKRLSGNTGMTLNIAFCYGGRKELANAFNRAVADGKTFFDEKTISEYLYTSGQPDPDLVIRTGGEKRISNFLLYQCAYSEFYFTDVLWPDFDKAELLKAIEDFSGRKRRYGR